MESEPGKDSADLLHTYPLEMCSFCGKDLFPAEIALGNLCDDCRIGAITM